ncbi:MAG: CarD family transcriptional regulator [Holosporaceae bacterium]|jgi:CarD family transcriptional regulator|nr:CarD family transcriptional regulator [Holosporaceae bacterium]
MGDVSRKARCTFQDGEFVVYPAHGVGVVRGIEKQNISGTELTVVVIEFEKDKMVVRLPLNGAISKKVRKLCSREEMQKAIKCLSTPSKVKKMMWSRRAQEYEAKINSGDPLLIAQVVRDLHRSASQPEHSYSERQIYQEAMDRLMREYAAVAKIGEVQALHELKKALMAA